MSTVSPLDVSPPWYSRAWQSIVRAFSGAQQPTEQVATYGAMWEMDAPQIPSYSVGSSMSAMGAFPMVRACVSAIAEDLGGLPLIVGRGDGDERELVDIPELARLFETPNVLDPSCPGVLFRQQMLVDLLLCGNAFTLMLGGKGKIPSALLRMHPEHTRPVPGRFGGPEGYIFGSEQDQRYAAADVLHVRLPSWESSPAAILGEGVIRPLHESLSAEMALRKRSRADAQTGSPTVIISAKDPTVHLSEEVAKQIRALYRRASTNREPLVVSGALSVDAPAFTAQEMQITEQQARSDDEVMAVFGVPPARLFRDTTNYATADAQMKGYWRGLVGKAALIEAQFSRVARRVAPDLYVRFDFSQVEALQEGRTDRLNRATVLVEKFGADPAEALRFEGFDDAPVGDQGGAPAPEPDQTPPEDDLGRFFRRSLDEEDPRLEQSEYKRPDRGWLEQIFDEHPKIWRAGGNIRGPAAWRYWGLYIDGDRSEGVLDWVKEREAWAARHYRDGEQLQGQTSEATLSSIAGIVAQAKWGVVGVLGWPGMKAAIRTVASKLDEESETRAIKWADWEAKVRAPTERRVQMDVSIALGSQSARVRGRLSALGAPQETVRAMVTRDLATDIVDAIFPPEEDAQLRLDLEDAIRYAIRQGYEFGLSGIGGELDLDLSRLTPEIRSQVATMVTRVNETTREQIRKAVVEVAEAGGSVNDIQAKIQSSVDFGPARSLLIARTETCRAISTGTEAAIQQAVSSGIWAEKTWLSARDTHVRDGHNLLDGETVNPGAAFTIPAGEWAGQTAKAPGGFGLAALDCNCRCAVIPSRVRT